MRAKKLKDFFLAFCWIIYFEIIFGFTQGKPVYFDIGIKISFESLFKQFIFQWDQKTNRTNVPIKIISFKQGYKIWSSAPIKSSDADACLITFDPNQRCFFKSEIGWKAFFQMWKPIKNIFPKADQKCFFKPSNHFFGEKFSWIKSDLVCISVTWLHESTNFHLIKSCTPVYYLTPMGKPSFQRT